MSRCFWSYRRFSLFRFPLTATLFGILVTVAMEIYPDYLRMAGMVKPAMAAYDVRLQLQIEYPWRGNWPDSVSHLPLDDGFNSYFETMTVSDHGSFSFKLESSDPVLDGQSVGFNLGRLDLQEGYGFYIWRCGGAAFSAAYTVDDSAATTLPRWYTRTLCRD